MSDTTTPLPFGHKPRAPRFSLDASILFKPQRRQNSKGLVRDISVSGAYLVSPESLRAGTEVLLYVDLPFGENKRLCILPAFVVRVETKPDSNLAGYGLTFAEKLATTSQEILNEFITFRKTGNLPRPSMVAEKLRPQASHRVQIEGILDKPPPGDFYDERILVGRSMSRLQMQRKRRRRNQAALWVSLSIGLLATLFVLSGLA